MIAASPDTLPNDADALRALVLAERAAKRLLMEERDGLAAERDALNAANEKLHHIIAVLRRARFGRKSERLSEDQLALVLEELETGGAKAEAEEEKKDEFLKRERAKKRRANRGALPTALQRIEQVIEPESILCPCFSIRPPEVKPASCQQLPFCVSVHSFVQPRPFLRPCLRRFRAGRAEQLSRTAAFLRPPKACS